MQNQIVYPIFPHKPTLFERIARKVKYTPGYCKVCGNLTLMGRWGENLRETGICKICFAKNRERQMATVICQVVGHLQGIRIRSLSALTRLEPCKSLHIYNTEAARSVHRSLSVLPGYVCSEYYGLHYISGQIVNGTLHQDLAELSFVDESFDLVLSADVFEHLPQPYLAHQEVFRVLKKNGRHIFTVPFHQTGYKDEILVSVENGEIKYHKEPIYHVDPLKKKGALVFTIFSIEMLLKLKEIGFHSSIYRLYNPALGILGPNGLVFEAIKTS